MERFLKLTIDGQPPITNSKQIEGWLYNSPYFWLLECEIDNVTLSVKDNILSWENGIFYYGTWVWGIWKKGEFRSGEWKGGIWLDGIFKGNWHRGVKKSNSRPK